MDKFKNKKMVVAAIVAAGALVSVSAEAAMFTQNRMRATGYSPTSTLNREGEPRQPGIFGKITSINGTNIIIEGKIGAQNTNSNITYSVDASNASFKKVSTPTETGSMPEETTISISDITVGNSVIIKGTISGTTVIASEVSVTDGTFMGSKYRGGNPTSTLRGGNSRDYTSSTNGERINIQKQANNERQFATTTQPAQNAKAVGFWQKFKNAFSRFFKK